MANPAMKAVYACRRQVAGLADDDTWRDFLAATTGKRSLRAMNGGELGKVIDALHERGAQKKVGKKGRRAGRNRPLADSAHAGKIRALWLSLWNLGALSDPSEDALAAFVKRQAGVDDTRFLAAEDADKVIEALKAWCARLGFVQPIAAEIEQINRWRLAAQLRPAGSGFAAKVKLIRRQWQALQDAGALRHGRLAGLETWLRGEAGVASPEHLLPEAADDVIAALGAWLRKTRNQTHDERVEA